MMQKYFRPALGAILILSSSLALACDYPARPYIPEGETATKDDMLTAKNAVQDFLADVDEYLRCVEEEEQRAITAIPEEARDTSDIQAREQALNRKFDAANEEKALVGEQFNKEVRAYNAKRQQTQE